MLVSWTVNIAQNVFSMAFFSFAQRSERTSHEDLEIVSLFNTPPPKVRQPSLAQVSSLLTFRDHSQTHHSRLDSSERVTTPTQRPLVGNTQHSRQKPIPPAGFRPAIQANYWRQNHALDRAAMGSALPLLLDKLMHVRNKGKQQAMVRTRGWRYSSTHS